MKPAGFKLPAKWFRILDNNLITHVIASRKRTALFEALQPELNIGVIEGKRWKLILDRGIRWNSTYLIIRRALKLQEALNIYALKLHRNSDAFD